MGIITASIFSLTTLLPQQPAPPPGGPAATTATALARVLPADVTAAVLVADLSPARTTLAPTPLGQLWQQQGAAMVQKELAELLGEGCGLTAAKLTVALSNGLALACTGTEEDGRQGFVLVVDTGAASTDVQRALEQVKGDSVDVDGTKVKAATFGEFGLLHTAMVGARMVASTHQDSIKKVLQLCTGASNACLSDDPEFRSIAADAGKADATLAALFVRTRELVANASTGLPPQYAAQATQAIAALGIARLGNVFASWRLQGNELVGRTRCSCPQLDGLLAALVGNPYRLDPRLARFVPASADGFVAAAIDLGAIARQILAVAARFSPDFAKAFDDNLAQLRNKLGFDLQKDLLDNFGGQVLTLSFATENGAHVGALLEVKDADKLAAVVKAAAGALPVPLTQEPHDGVTMYLLPEQGRGRMPGFAAVERQFVLADDRDTLAQLIDVVLHPSSNAETSAFLRQQPKTVTWASRNRIGGGLQAFLASMATGVPMAKPTTGYEWHTCSRDELGIVLDGSSSLPQAASLALGAPDVPAMTPIVAVTPPTMPSAGPVDPAPAGEVAAIAAPDPEEVQALLALEAAPKADANKLIFLLHSSHPGVAARAAWLAGKRRVKDAVPALAEVLGSSTVDLVRLHCAAALYQLKDKRAQAAATAALGDREIRVRTLAALLLGGLESTTATAPLLAMIDEREHDDNTGKRIDVVAGILALADLGTTAILLPTASAIAHDDASIGQALAYLFQRHSSALPKRDEAVLLMAVLAHPSKALRRFAIQRLGELRDPSAAASLQGRLAVEDREMQPVLEVALTALRGDNNSSSKAASDLWEQTRTNCSALVLKAKERWAGLDQTHRMMLLGCVGIGLLALLGFTRLRARARRRARVDAAAALVSASPDLVDAEPAEQQEEAEAGYETVGDGRAR